MIFVTVAAFIAALIAIAYIVMNYYPSFGGKATAEEKEGFLRSPNYSQGKFVYPVSAEIDLTFGGNFSILKDFLKGNPLSKPAKPLLPEPLPPGSVQLGREAKATWFGHSAVLLELDGITVFIDPMLGRSPSPFPFIGGRRYSEKLPIEISALPDIDAVLLSHDHYDHLDYGSIQQMKHKVGMFIVPLGVGAHLQRWGVSPAQIREHDWWNEFRYAGLTFICAPARHFSGRSLLDRNTTLWCSWIIQGENVKIFYSGDSGYGPHFAEIGQKYGPFDLTLMECGQYDTRWADIHMMPEQTVQAHMDVRGGVLLPVHWGAFTLAMHDWTDPIDRVSRAADQKGVRLATPRIGEPVYIGAPECPSDLWWREV